MVGVLVKVCEHTFFLSLAGEGVCFNNQYFFYLCGHYPFFSLMLLVFENDGPSAPLYVTCCLYFKCFCV